MRPSQRLLRQQNYDARASNRSSARYRQATVTALDPFTVEIGGAEIEDVPVIEGAVLAVNDVVECVETRGILLVLGRTGGRSQSGTQSVTGDGTTTRTLTVAHDLGVAPSVVLATANNSSLNVATGTYTSTNFTLAVLDVSGSTWSSTHNVRWLALP